MTGAITLNTERTMKKSKKWQKHQTFSFVFLFYRLHGCSLEKSGGPIIVDAAVWDHFL